MASINAGRTFTRSSTKGLNQSGKFQDGALTQSRHALFITEQDAMLTSQRALHAVHERNDLVAAAHEGHRTALREKLAQEHQEEHALTEQANSAEEELFGFRTTRNLEDDHSSRNTQSAKTNAENADALAEAWRAKVGNLEARCQQRAAREQGHLKRATELADGRVREATANAELRMARADQRIADTTEALRVQEEEVSEDQFHSVEAGVEQAFKRKQICAGAVKHDSEVKVRFAMDEARRLKASALKDIQQGRQRMQDNIQGGKQNRWESLQEAEAAIADEDVCTRRSEYRAREMENSALHTCDTEVARKDREKAFTEAQLSQAKVGFDERERSYARWVEKRQDKAEQRAAKERAHLEKETELAEEKVELLQNQIWKAEMEIKARQARVAQEWSDGDNLGDSRRAADATRVTDEAIADANARLAAMEKRCEERVAKSKAKAKAVLERAQQRLLSLEELAGSRVSEVGSSAQRQAEKLEADVSQAEEAWKEWEARIDDRVEEGRRACNERVEMKQRRMEDELGKTEKRREDAEKRKNASAAAEEAAADKVNFAVAYLRAVGFGHYADEVLLRPKTPDFEEEARLQAEEDARQIENLPGQETPDRFEEEGGLLADGVSQWPSSLLVLGAHDGARTEDVEEDPDPALGTAEEQAAPEGAADADGAIPPEGEETADAAAPPGEEAQGAEAEGGAPEAAAPAEAAPPAE